MVPLVTTSLLSLYSASQHRLELLLISPQPAKIKTDFHKTSHSSIHIFILLTSHIVNEEMGKLWMSPWVTCWSLWMWNQSEAPWDNIWFPEAEVLSCDYHTNILRSPAESHRQQLLLELKKIILSISKMLILPTTSVYKVLTSGSTGKETQNSKRVLGFGNSETLFRRDFPQSRLFSSW